eukprot:jgi/Botrbrau1/2726/Bobra.0164s0006.1
MCSVSRSCARTVAGTAQALYSSREGAVHGYAWGRAPSAEISLQRGEQLVAASGVFGQGIQQLTFVTSLGRRLGPYGLNSTTGTPFSFTGKIYSIAGANSEDLSVVAAIAFWTDPANGPSPAPPPPAPALPPPPPTPSPPPSSPTPSPPSPPPKPPVPPSPPPRPSPPPSPPVPRPPPFPPKPPVPPLPIPPPPKSPPPPPRPPPPVPRPPNSPPPPPGTRMPECPNTAVPAPYYPVCLPPSPVFTSLTIKVSGDNSSGENCRMDPCFNNDCTCRNIFAYAACGTFTLPLNVVARNYEYGNGGYVYTNNHQYVGWWLRTIGLADVQTLLKDLTITVDTGLCSYDSCLKAAFSWTIDIFPKLEVVRGTLNFQHIAYPAQSFALLPGTGLAKLRVTGRTTFTAPNGPGGWATSDLSVLSSLVCPGTQIDFSALSTLSSLSGLERVADGNPALLNQTCLFNFTNSYSVLFNVSAIASFGGCGGKQRPDNSSVLPCLTTWCSQINTWTGLCTYVANGGFCL